MEISLPTLIAAIDAAELGEPHAVLVGAERFVSRRIRHHARRAVWDELNQAGFARGERLADDFLDTLVAIQRASVEYYGWVTDAAVSRGILAAAIGPDAVILSRYGSTVYFERLRPEDVVGTFVAQLPDIPPARGAAISVMPDHAPQRRRLDALMSQPRTGGAKLYRATRDYRGIRHRSPHWITVVDTQNGRWVTYLTGDGAINAVPGTRQVMVSKLTEL